MIWQKWPENEMSKCKVIFSRALSLDGSEFELKQFHFHAPSENHINGKSYSLEAHLVHSDKSGNLAVVSIMYQVKDENSIIKKLWSAMPEKAEIKNPLKASINALDLLPAEKSYYRFNGSLTTPPCTEGVRWFVMKQPVTVSKQQGWSHSRMSCIMPITFRL